MTQLVIAFAGFGKSANRYHLPYLKNRSQIKVKMVYDHRFRHYHEQQDNLKASGVELTTDFTDILEDSDVQMIAITTPAATHYSLAKQALLHGKNILVEKPFCETAEQAEELLKLAKENGLIAMPFQNRRFDSDYLALKHVLEVGYVGEPLTIESHMDHFRPSEQFVNSDPINGQFYGLGIHTIDQIVALFGQPQRVFYDIRAQQNQGTLDDYYETQLFYPKLKAVVSSGPLVATPYPSFRLNGTKGSFVKYGIDQQENDLKAGIMPDQSDFGQDAPNAFGHLKYLNGNGDWIEKDLPTPVGDYGRVYDAMYAAIIEKKSKLVTDQELLIDMRILEAGVSEQGPHVKEF
ncbi:MAG TPA: oxidoreductase [Lapidilactobacillus dextrinicus]|uniref:Oxidoreductase n=1 Tax=Lapidilactobacillus dextrinicus TaxID=51664 RepID=A0A921B3F4_9LACO|nr:oxidoreductase [Lapidilactobacillus dextrinicus]